MHLDAGESKTEEMSYFFCFMDYSDLDVCCIFLIYLSQFITLSIVAIFNAILEKDIKIWLAHISWN